MRLLNGSSSLIVLHCCQCSFEVVSMSVVFGKHFSASLLSSSVQFLSVLSHEFTEKLIEMVRSKQIIYDVTRREFTHTKKIFWEKQLNLTGKFYLVFLNGKITEFTAFSVNGLKTCSKTQRDRYDYRFLNRLVCCKPY